MSSMARTTKPVDLSALYDVNCCGWDNLLNLNLGQRIVYGDWPKDDRLVLEHRRGMCMGLVERLAHLSNDLPRLIKLLQVLWSSQIWLRKPELLHTNMLKQSTKEKRRSISQTYTVNCKGNSDFYGQSR